MIGIISDTHGLLTIYMDRVTELRKILESVYDKEAM